MSTLSIAARCLLLTAVSLASLLPRGLFAQADPPAAWTYQGVSRCERCHLAPLDDDKKKGVTDFITLTESQTWSKGDKHALAFELIDPDKSPLARQMCKLLKIDDIRQTQQCLSCHANWLKGQPQPPTFARGVICESCHGPSSGWDGPHSVAEWRKKSAADKEKLGMVEIRHPLRRAEQCFGCHIGNVKEGKVVTHEMYAAGHPPLPGIEIESFASQMPSHWRYLREKPAFEFRQEFLAANFAHLANSDGREMHRTKAVVLGGITALTTYAQLLLDQASTPGQWPELASFHCAACHHDLRPAGESGPRQFGSKVVGRPPLQQWPVVLLKVALRINAGADDARHAASLAQFQTAYDRLRTAIASRPLGDASQVRIAAESLIGGLQKLANTLAVRPFSIDDAQRARTLLWEMAAGNDASDYHAARQIAWALREIETELAAPYADDPSQIAAWQDSVRAPAIKHVQSLFTAAGLVDRMVLDLPTRQDQSIVDRQSAALQAIADFDYAWYQRQMQELAGKLLNR
jgi:mono/diheme cytochrome c family protein